MERHRLYGSAFDSGEELELKVAGRSHTWIRTDVPWIVTLEKTEGNPDYDFLDVDYVISDVEVLDHYICTSNPLLTGHVDPDIKHREPESDDYAHVGADQDRECFSYYRVLDALSD